MLWTVHALVLAGLLVSFFSPVVVVEGATGLMTMWTTEHPGPISGGSCEYASSAATTNGASWLKTHVNKRMYCAVNSALYKGGMGCGSCYKISFSGKGGTDGGRAGSAKIQVVDSGSAKEFDCQLSAFQEITGVGTGIYPISYKRVPCNPTPPKVVVLDGMNAWYTKILVAGGRKSVKSVKMFVGKTSYPMFRVSGATFAANLKGIQNKPTKFVITWITGKKKKVIIRCFNGKWPVQTGTQCK